MAIRPFNFYVEMEKNDYTPVGEVKQLDTMELDIKVLENSIPKNLESSEISLYVRKKDGTILEQKENINVVEASEGTIKIKVKNQATACVGMTLFELELKGADGIATTGTFIFVVNERVVNGEVVESKDEIHALVEVEKYVKLAKEELQRFKELQTEMLRTNETMNFQENLRNVAETERISAEEERKEKESERVESEGNRVTAEGLRANAESSRANAENSRERKERERVTAEVSRVDAEALRVSEEKKRVNAENSRANAERSRIDAESVRVAEEKKRVTAETARAENEDARVLAERNREENFSQFEDKINEIGSDMSKNTKELKNARTGTTGEEFNSLDERIDCEVDRLNKKIDVTMLQQEDKESHDINNTVEGMTTDMIVKGRTLKNLSPDGVWDCSNISSFNHSYQNVQLEQGYNFIKCTQPLPRKYNIIGYDNNNIKPLTNYIHIADVEIVNNPNSDNCLFHLGSFNYKKNKTINNGRGVIVAIGKTTDNVVGGNNAWIGVRLGADTSEGENRSFIVYNISTYEITEEESNKDVEELLKKYPVKCEGIKSFGQQEDKISILSTGKNLADNSIFDINNYDNSLYRIYNKKFKPNTNYTCKSYLKKEFNKEKIRIWMRINEKNIISNSESYPHVTTTVGNNGMLKIDFYCEGISKDQEALTFIKEHFNIQLEEGTQATSYQPYKEDKKDILLSSLGFDEGLRGFNSTVCDELNDIRRVVVKTVEKYISKGNETIAVHTVRNDTISFNYIFNGGTPKGKNSNPNFIANCFVTNLACYSNDVEGCFGTPNGFYGSISKAKLESPDMEGITKYVRQNFKECYYELAQPIETPLTDPINVKTFSEKTYVSFLNSLKGTSNFKAPVDTVLALSNLTDDIKNKTDKKEADEINERATESLELSEYNHSDINDNIFPYLMDLELMVLDMMELNGYTNKKYKISERAGIHMTSKQALERLIRQKKVTLEDALDRIVRYNDAGRITDAEALELTDLAHEIL